MNKKKEPGRAEGREEYTQVGFTALRDPVTGAFLPSVPLYVKADDVTEEAEERMIADFAQLMALKMQAYQDGCRKAGVAV